MTLETTAQSEASEIDDMSRGALMDGDAAVQEHCGHDDCGADGCTHVHDHDDAEDDHSHTDCDTTIPSLHLHDHDHDHGDDDTDAADKSENILPSEVPEISNTSDDYAGDSSTTGTLQVGGSANGNLEVSYDTDWFALTLTAGQTVQIDQTGITLDDPLLRMRDASGNLVGYDDDGGPGLNPSLTFTATNSGTYYVEAGGYSNHRGTYTLEVTGAEATTYDDYDPVDALLWGTELADPETINVYFGTSGYSAGVVVPGTPAVTSEGFTAYERERFIEAFERVEAVTNITFNVVNSASSADFRLVLDTNEMQSGLLGYFTLPTSNGTGTALGVFNGNEWDRSAGGDLEAGGIGFATITHELLHGLGMAHGHDAGGTSDVLPGVSSAFGSFGIHGLNQGVYTTQSYNGGLSTGAAGTSQTNASWGGEAGPMALDIGALQRLYGANTTTAAGNDVYTLDASNGLNTHWESIWDTGGVDEIRHTGSAGATINLRAATLQGEVGGGGFLSQANGIAGGFTIANGVMIENATGGSGDDVLIGNDGANQLIGAGGDDTLEGGGGADMLMAGAGSDSMDGGAGVDTVNYSASSGSLRVDLLFSQINTNIAAGDTYTDIENLVGSRGADNIRGTFDANLLQGAGNVDYIFGRRGNDTLDGGVGNDVLFGGADADVLIGGENRDRAQYSESLTAIVVDLMNTARNTGEAIGDTYASIEDLAGGAFADNLSGDTGNNWLFGREGNDMLYGRGGDDYLNGGANSDRLDGGLGNDTLRGGQSADTFVFNGGRDVIEDMTLNHNDRLGIEARAIDQVTGLSGAQVVAQFASVENGTAVLRFDGDNTVVLQNISTLADLETNIFVF